VQGGYDNGDGKIVGRVAVDVRSTHTRKNYSGLPYGNALIQDISHRHNVHFINMHIAWSKHNFSLPMNTDNVTGKATQVATKDNTDAFIKNGYLELEGVGGFRKSILFTKNFLADTQKSKKFMGVIAKDFAQHKD